MISFDSSLIRFEYVKLKSVSTALGGSARILDEKASEEQGKEVTVRYEVPFAVARQFQKTHKPASFLFARDACIVWFGDQVVMIESRPDVDRRVKDITTPSGREWIATSELNFDRYIRKEAVGDDWFTDGTFVYKLPDDIGYEISNAEYLTSDGMFRGLTVHSFKFADLEQSQLLSEPATRSIVACVRSTGEVVLTPPIWKNVLDIRKNDDTTNKDDTPTPRFDLIDQNFHVNLEFALNAGRTVGDVFGYDHIGPLKLDELMIHLRTVNLPKVPKSTRQTFGISMPFVQAFAWVAGLTAKCETMSEFSKMRALMKQLCTKGIFRSQMLNNIYKDGVQNVAPPMIDPQAALERVQTTMSTDDLHTFWRKGQTDDDKIDQSVLNAIGSMVQD